MRRLSYIPIVLTASWLGYVYAAELVTGFSEPRDVEFKAAIDGTSQRYVELLPPGFDPKQEHPLMIALHGHGSDRWQFIKQNRPECAGIRAAALKRRMVLISPDYRAPDSWMGPVAEADVLQIIDETRKRYKIGKIILSGGSMGGTSVLIFAALHPDLISGGIALNPMANMVEYEGFQKSIQKSYGGTKQQKPEEFSKRSAELHPDKFTMPLAITTGGRDTTVPPQSAQRLAEALKKKNARVLILHRETTAHSTNLADTIEAAEFVLAAVLGTAP